VNPAHRFALLGRQQLSLQEGIAMLEQIQRELEADRASAKAWALTAILANVTLVPLNVIVNSFQLGTAASLYQAFARTLYQKVAASGTRGDGHVMTALAALKTVVAQELQRKGLASQVPGANILIGLAEDSVALLQAVQTVQAGNSEMAQQAEALRQNLARARRQWAALGIERARAHDAMEVWNRTA
jgi:hypothetical protein